MRRISFRRAAKSEFQNAVRWYEKQRTGLGADFLRSVNACLDIIRSQPEIFPVVYRTVWRGNTKRFPFSILYYIADDRIVILSVFHTSRDPEVWKKRF